MPQEFFKSSSVNNCVVTKGVSSGGKENGSKLSRHFRSSVDTFDIRPELGFTDVLLICLMAGGDLVSVTSESSSSLDVRSVWLSVWAETCVVPCAVVVAIMGADAAT